MFLKSDLFYFVLVAKAYGFCLRARPVNSDHIWPRRPRAVYKIFRSLYIQLVCVFVNKTLTTVSNPKLTSVIRVYKSKSVRNLGSWFDENFSMETHINKVSKTAFNRLHNIRRI